MIKIFTNRDYLKYSLLLFSFSFCFGIAINSIAYGFFTVIALFQLIKTMSKYGIKTFIKENLIFWPLILLFLILLIREMGVGESGATLDIIRKYSPFMIIPLVIGFQPKKYSKYIDDVLRAFLYGCLLSVMIGFLFAFYRGALMNDGAINFWYFSYNLFAEPFHMQPIYLAFFYVFAIFILHYLNYAKSNKVFYWISFIALFLSVLLLSARNALGSLIILLPLYLLIEKKLSWKRLLFLFGTVSLVFLIALQNPVVKNRILKVNDPGNFYSGSSLRMNIWKSGLEVGKQNYLFGSGVKESNYLLVEEFKESNLTIPVKFNYNAHSQYMQTFIQTGALGLLLLFILLIYGIKGRENFYLIWIMFIAITSLTESVFMRQWGVLSVTLFTSLLFLKKKPNENSHTRN